jgi:hypothetical protein
MRRKYAVHKFKAKAVQDDGHHFSSQIEHDYYLHLRMLMKTEDVLFFLRQVPIHLPGGVKYVVDFMVFHETGEVEFVDVKGVETESFKAKKRMVEALYPFEITVVKAKDFKRKW